MLRAYVISVTMETADVNKVTRMRLKCGRNPRVRSRAQPADTSIRERNVCSRKAIMCDRIIEFLSKHASRTSNSRTLSWEERKAGKKRKESCVRETGKKQRKEGNGGEREEKMSHGACAAVPPMRFCFTSSSFFSSYSPPSGDFQKAGFWRSRR